MLVELLVSFTSFTQPLPVGDSSNILNPVILSTDGASFQSIVICVVESVVNANPVGTLATGFNDETIQLRIAGETNNGIGSYTGTVEATSRA